MTAELARRVEALAYDLASGASVEEKQVSGILYCTLGALSSGRMDALAQVILAFAERETGFPPKRDDVRMGITQHNGGYLYSVLSHIKHIYEASISWEAKYESIFKLANALDRAGFGVKWYDPDTSYEEDVCAYVHALREKYTDTWEAIPVTN